MQPDAASLPKLSIVDSADLDSVFISRARSAIPCMQQGLPGGAAVSPAVPERLDSYISRVELDYLQQRLTENKGQIAKTADSLGISRKTLWEKLRRHHQTAGV